MTDWTSTDEMRGKTLQDKTVTGRMKELKRTGPIKQPNNVHRRCSFYDCPIVSLANNNYVNVRLYIQYYRSLHCIEVSK